MIKDLFNEGTKTLAKKYNVTTTTIHRWKRKYNTPPNAICVRCEMPYVSLKKNQKYCSKKCSGLEKKEPIVIIKRCETCSNVFSYTIKCKIENSYSKKYCSKTCRYTR